MPAESISVSDLLRVSVCPMQLYLAKSSPAEFVEPLSYSVAKQLSYHLGGEIDRDVVLDELKLTVPEFGDEGIQILDKMFDACQSGVWETAEDVDVAVHSEKYGMHGRIDRLFADSFSIVKGGSAPPHGVYTTDRLQAVCYALCLQEMQGKEYTAKVEYLGSGTVRTVTLSPSDRRVFLTVLKSARKIQQGEVPRAVRGSKCVHCRFAEVCKPLEKPQSLFERLQRPRQ